MRRYNLVSFVYEICCAKWFCTLIASTVFVASWGQSSFVCSPTPPDDITKNWVQETSFDLDGNIISDEITYSDQLGRQLQTQTSNLEQNMVFVSEVLYDKLGKPVISTLPAPSLYCGFTYLSAFTQNSGGTKYSVADFDKSVSSLSSPTLGEVFNPAAIGTGNGTTGWYYSVSNNIESQTPAVAFPYLRSFSCFPEVTVQGGADYTTNFKTGKQSFSAVLHMFNELDHYVAKSSFYASNSQSLPSSIYRKGFTKAITKDANGIEMVSFFNPDGQLVAEAEVDYSSSAVTKLNSVSSSSNYLFHDIHLTDNNKSSLVITCATSIDLIDLSTGLILYRGAPGSVSIPSGGSGYYRICSYRSASNPQPVTVGIQFNTSYTNFSYNYYNLAGQLIASVEPNNTQVGAENAIATTYTSNSWGQVLRTFSQDEGKTEFVYRKDGQLRFSKNDKQFYASTPMYVGATAHSKVFSYTQYDRFARPVESGQYNSSLDYDFWYFFQPQDATTATTSAYWRSALTIVESIVTTPATDNLETAKCSDRNIAIYALTDPTSSISQGSNVYKARNVAGGISSTKNDNNQTWYSYDDYGRLEWTVQNIAGLGYKTISYTYDLATGNLTQVAYAKGQSDQFYQYLSYDKNQKLKKVESSLDGITRQEEAEYKYYAHGPLKRTELANDVQGIDYVYTINGSLKSINHFSRTNLNLDPGKDGTSGSSFAQDVFGTTLHYHDNDYNSSYYQNVGYLGGSFANSSGIKRYNAGLPYAISWKNMGNNLSSPWGTANGEINFYVYDSRYQFSANGYAQLINGTTVDPGNYQTVISTDGYSEKNITYDNNGNLLFMKRFAGSSSPTFSGTYTYGYAQYKNRVSSIEGFSSQMAYNYTGQLTGYVNQQSQSVLFDYNLMGMLSKYSLQATGSSEYLYNDQGFRMLKTNKGTSNELLGKVYYVRDVNGNILSIYNVTSAGVVTQDELPIYGQDRIGFASRKTSSTNREFDYYYELNDHLGSTRAIIGRTKTSDNKANILSWTDYYPYGLPMQGSAGISSRYSYQGQFSEKDGENNLHHFDLRTYEPIIGRWLSTDPYGQNFSPYSAMSNNPIVGIDPDGGWSWIGAGVGALAGGIGGYATTGDWRAAAAGAVIGGVAGGLLTPPDDIHRMGNPKIGNDRTVRLGTLKYPYQNYNFAKSYKVTNDVNLDVSNTTGDRSFETRSSSTSYRLYQINKNSSPIPWDNSDENGGFMRNRDPRLGNELNHTVGPMGNHPQIRIGTGVDNSVTTTSLLRNNVMQFGSSQYLSPDKVKVTLKFTLQFQIVHSFWGKRFSINGIKVNKDTFYKVHRKGYPFFSPNR